jgi:hypothetical protein
VTTLPRFAMSVLLAAVTACAVLEPPGNPFDGLWTTPEKNQIAFRDGTIVVPGENNQPMTMSAASCEGAFGFDYGRKNRDALIRLTPHQPDLTGKLSNLLAQADYPVAELTCGEGASTYVLLDERDLLVIHRDRDIAAIERMSRL